MSSIVLKPADLAPPATPCPVTDVVLQTEGLCKYWGGLKALDDLSLQFHDRRLHGIVGPNGAGKSTLLNLLCGSYAPTRGKILHNGEAIDAIRPHEFSRRGIGRGFQKTNIYPSATCLENCSIAAQRRVGGSFNIFRSRHSDRLLTEMAAQALEKVGLSHRRDAIASRISYGEQRQLEIATVLATAPSVLLLDEPMAGMGHEESQLIIQLLKSLKQDYCIVLVEHDMDAVFALSDQLTVLVDGQHLVTDSVERVRDDARVKHAYLGQGDEVI
ncbi:ABC transporter ATP-binding protein [Marinobacterium rhizophilum]|uniref:ABC transporter ATP-binding protein n=1 Tax=Marinobacterium rhizophilum TaxID=420402 RepID=A0ABY5HNM6_9GAMM|nr:ABC transporter ATP-binding protein [Marinobacterium rhizophilum]UTW12800.1 ABC transporter ATP-binding protein [Marinobacterium rhizophilum]